jgi:hypothetical protein
MLKSLLQQSRACLDNESSEVWHLRTPARSTPSIWEWDATRSTEAQWGTSSLWSDSLLWKILLHQQLHSFSRPFHTNPHRVSTMEKGKFSQENHLRGLLTWVLVGKGLHYTHIRYFWALIYSTGCSCLEKSSYPEGISMYWQQQIH